jgi:hypothetical protein
LENTMPQKTALAHCPFRNTDVNLRLGLRHCIEDQQCFSDEPCPLRDEFLQAGTLAAHKAAQASKVAPAAKRVAD